MAIDIAQSLSLPNHPCLGILNYRLEKVRTLSTEVRSSITAHQAEPTMDRRMSHHVDDEYFNDPTELDDDMGDPSLQNPPPHALHPRSHSMIETSSLHQLQPPQHNYTSHRHLQHHSPHQSAADPQWSHQRPPSSSEWDIREHPNLMGGYNPMQAPGQVGYPLASPRVSRTSSNISSMGDSQSRESSQSKDTPKSSKKDRKQYELKNDMERSDKNYKEMRKKNNEAVKKTRQKQKEVAEAEDERKKEMDRQKNKIIKNAICLLGSNSGQLRDGLTDVGMRIYEDLLNEVLLERAGPSSSNQYSICENYQN